jgi:hypothetical protein
MPDMALIKFEVGRCHEEFLSSGVYLSRKPKIKYYVDRKLK